MNARGKTIDKTFLSLDQAEERGFIHRDYIAHCHRWSHVVKRLYAGNTYRTARILDVGCGRELPLPKLLYSNRLIPEAYCAVDVGPIEDEAIATFGSGKFPITAYEKTDFMDLELIDMGGKEPTHIVCFEVLEHVEPEHMLKMLARMRQLLIPTEGIAMISTPCWNRRDTAANHVDEITYEALGAIFEGTGWSIIGHYGTFASLSDYKQLMLQDERSRDIFHALSEYYDTNVLSTIFAPMFPQHSRNALWVVTPAPNGYGGKQFKKLWECEQPYGSSVEAWKELANSNKLEKYLTT